MKNLKCVAHISKDEMCSKEAVAVIFGFSFCGEHLMVSFKKHIGTLERRAKLEEKRKQNRRWWKPWTWFDYLDC